MPIADGIAEISSALGALQSAANIVTTLMGIRRAGDDSSKLIELNGKIIAAQSSIIQANAAQSAPVDRIRELERTIADLETWDAEKTRYELKSLAPGSFAYGLKANENGSEPIHYICQSCYENRKKSILQRKPPNPIAAQEFGEKATYVCPRCHSEIQGA
jgi:Zn finger protein HypA/HybF involved in hydrogenase expression